MFRTTEKELLALIGELFVENRQLKMLIKQISERQDIPKEGTTPSGGTSGENTGNPQ